MLSAVSNPYRRRSNLAQNVTEFTYNTSCIDFLCLLYKVLPGKIVALLPTFQCKFITGLLWFCMFHFLLLRRMHVTPEACCWNYDWSHMFFSQKTEPLPIKCSPGCIHPIYLPYFLHWTSEAFLRNEYKWSTICTVCKQKWTVISNPWQSLSAIVLFIPIFTTTGKKLNWKRCILKMLQFRHQ